MSEPEYGQLDELADLLDQLGDLLEDLRGEPLEVLLHASRELCVAYQLLDRAHVLTQRTLIDFRGGA